MKVTQHLTLRVAWHDSRWNGQVCAAPSKNSFCAMLDRIRVERNDKLEDSLRSKSWADPRTTPSLQGRIRDLYESLQDQTMRYDILPNAVYTIPEIASVGHTEKSAATLSRNIQTHTVLFRHIGKAHVINEISGQAKIISDSDTGKILGVHIIGPHATDLIAEATLSIQKNCTVKELADTIHAHPILSEIMMETALKASGNPIHG